MKNIVLSFFILSTLIFSQKTHADEISDIDTVEMNEMSQEKSNGKPFFAERILNKNFISKEKWTQEALAIKSLVQNKKITDEEKKQIIDLAIKAGVITTTVAIAIAASVGLAFGIKKLIPTSKIKLFLEHVGLQAIDVPKIGESKKLLFSFENNEIEVTLERISLYNYKLKIKASEPKYSEIKQIIEKALWPATVTTSIG